MQYVLLRDGSTYNNLYPVPVLFQRVPCVNEWVWLGNKAFVVQVVSHTWDDHGQPLAIVDIGAVAAQQGTMPGVTGMPQ
jgi:hypothetical protein